MSAGEFPTTARVVFVGGGVMGCGLAYHLAHGGWSDVVLLEKAELTSGSTWHTAEQITHSTSSYGLGKCVDYNIGLYAGGLEEETGMSVTWHGCGSFRLAYADDEVDWLRHTMSVGRALGFPIELVGPKEIRRHHPFYNLEGVQAALYTPEDGHADPTGVPRRLLPEHGPRVQGSSAAAVSPTSRSSRAANGWSSLKKATFFASMWSMPAAPMRGRWASGAACSFP